MGRAAAPRSSAFREKGREKKRIIIALAEEIDHERSWGLETLQRNILLLLLTSFLHQLLENTYIHTYIHTYKTLFTLSYIKDRSPGLLLGGAFVQSTAEHR